MKDLWLTNFSKKKIYIKDLEIYVEPNGSLNLKRFASSLGENRISYSVKYGDVKTSGLIVSQRDLNLSEPDPKLSQKCFPKASVSAIKIEYKKFSELENALSDAALENMSDEEKEDMERKLIAEQEDKLLEFMSEE